MKTYLRIDVNIHEVGHNCRSSLETYPQIGNVILDNDLSLNLYVVPLSVAWL